MEGEGDQVTRKRLKPPLLQDNGEASDKAEFETNDAAGAGAVAVASAASEEMELNISHILEKIENFTHLVSELLESGKTIFKELSNEFQERIIAIHKEQVEKWQEEIKQLRLLDASNEEAMLFCIMLDFYSKMLTLIPEVQVFYKLSGINEFHFTISKSLNVKNPSLNQFVA